VIERRFDLIFEFAVSQNLASVGCIADKLKQFRRDLIREQRSFCT
jgi:hypothetical protein